MQFVSSFPHPLATAQHRSEPGSAWSVVVMVLGWECCWGGECGVGVVWVGCCGGGGRCPWPIGRGLRDGVGGAGGVCGVGGVFVRGWVGSGIAVSGKLVVKAIV